MPTYLPSPYLSFTGDCIFCTKCFTASPTLLNGNVFSFSLTLFRWDQMNQAVVPNSSLASGFVTHNSTRSMKDPCVVSTSFTQLNSILHTCLTASHSHRACFVLSRNLLDNWHREFATIFLFIRLTFVGRQSVQALQKN